MEGFMSCHKDLLWSALLVAAWVVPQTATATSGTIPSGAMAALKARNPKINVDSVTRNFYRSGRLEGPRYDREGVQVPGHAFVVKANKINYLLVQPHKGTRWEAREIARPMRGNKPSRNVTKSIPASGRPFGLAFTSQGPAADAVVGIKVRGAKAAYVKGRGQIFATSVGPGNTITCYAAPARGKDTIKTLFERASGNRTPVRATITQAPSSLRLLHDAVR
jgi:hypothetical protein